MKAMTSLQLKIAMAMSDCIQTELAMKSRVPQTAISNLTRKKAMPTKHHSSLKVFFARSGIFFPIDGSSPVKMSKGEVVQLLWDDFEEMRERKEALRSALLALHLLEGGT